VERNYWSKVLAGRMTRRTALAVAGGGAAAAFLAACGGSGSEDTSDKSSLLTKAADTSNRAKRGGSYLITTADPQHFDPHTTLNGSTRAYSLLLNQRSGHLQQPDGTYQGEAAESYEFSPDGLTLTFRLRPNATFHNISPVNGRPVDSADIVYSWKRYESVGSNRADFFQTVSATAPMASYSAPDARTFVIKLVYPMYGGFLSMVTPQGGGGHGMYIIPKEAESFDIRTKVIGSGPWQLSSYQPSVAVVWKRHEGFYDKALPYIDEINSAVVPEYASGLAQFSAGHLHAFDVRQEDVLQTKQNVPQLNMYLTDVSDPSLLTQFGWDAGIAENKPWRDERVRQAYSMSLDRDLWIDTFYNVSKFQQSGLPSEAFWATTFQASLPFEGYVLNPQDQKAFGPNAKYYHHDLAEAKKLLAAAGYTDGFEATSTFRSSLDQRMIGVLENMANEAGFKFNDKLISAAEDANNRDSRGKNQGIAHVQKPVVSSAGSDPLEAMIRLFSAKANSRYFLGFDVNGRGDFSGDSFLEDLLLKARGEVDLQKRKAAVHEVQRYVAKAQYLTRFPGGAPLFTLRWPVVQNYNVFKGDARADMTLWLDQTKPPISKT